MSLTFCFQQYQHINFTVRLSRGSAISTGIVEVNIKNTWGPICDNQWTDRNTGTVVVLYCMLQDKWGLKPA